MCILRLVYLLYESRDFNHINFVFWNRLGRILFERMSVSEFVVIFSVLVSSYPLASVWFGLLLSALARVYMSILDQGYQVWHVQDKYCRYYRLMVILIVKCCVMASIPSRWPWGVVFFATGPGWVLKMYTDLSDTRIYPTFKFHQLTTSVNAKYYTTIFSWSVRKGKLQFDWFLSSLELSVPDCR